MGVTSVRFNTKEEKLLKYLKEYYDSASQRSKHEYAAEPKEISLSDFKQRFNKEYSHISHSLSDKQIEKYLNQKYIKDASIEKKLDLFQDYLFLHKYF
mgnify:CR=1 FL=1